MKSRKVSIKEVKLSPHNPRVIKNNKFMKLVNSIKNFPQMLDLRPIVVDEDMEVLGGNMRLRACMEIGLKEVPIIQVKELTAEQKKEFVIKDNSAFGEWDWDLLANEWDIEDLDDWGLDIPASYFDEDVEPEFDMDELDQRLENYIDAKVKQITLYFDNDQYEEVLSSLQSIATSEGLDNNTDVVVKLIEMYEKTGQTED